MSTAEVRQLAARADLPDAIMHAALEWLVLVWSREATPEQLQALAQWRAADPDHERAWRHVQQLDEQLAAVPGSIAAASLRAADSAGGRRSFVLALGLIVASGAATYALRETAGVRSRFADLRTATGEIRTLTLADGTHLTLNTATAVNLRFDSNERRVVLVDGEILIATAADPAAVAGRARPFLVDTAFGRVEPIGTRFTVRHTGPATEVAVLEGAVRIAPELASAPPVRLDAGGRARFTTASVQRLPGTIAAAWADGLLVAEQMRLEDFLAELNRYRPGIIRCHRNATGLRVSGTFPVRDTERVLATLAQALPIRISHRSRYWVSVEAR